MASSNKRIYMDNHATTPVDPRVLAVMLPYFTETFGNAASRHHPYGWEAEEAVESARAAVARIIGAQPKEIVFTSGATESNNLAIQGAARAAKDKGRHILTVRTEHKAVIDTCRFLEKSGFDVTYLPVQPNGILDLGLFEKSLKSSTILISVMMANNEIGVLQPVEKIGVLAKKRGVLFHCDAAQGVGKIPVDVEKFGIDLLSLSAHKMYGPKGVGGLYIRRKNPRVKLDPIVYGGGHEKGFRSGTLNVPGIVGLGKACELASKEMETEIPRLVQLRDDLWSRIQRQLEGVFLQGHPTKRLPGNLNLSFEGVEGESLLLSLKGLAVSSGAACTSASLEPSHVLKALGVNESLAQSSLRFGLGRFNTAEDVHFAAQEVVSTVEKLRKQASV